jgi:site-specific recombinase XerD
MAKINLQTPTARGRLTPRGKPYKVTLLPGVHLGYRAAQSGTGAWLVIASDGKGGQWQKVFAHADDKQPADGSAVLTYEQATHAARALARGDANAAAARPATIGEALEAYEADLTARGRNAYNARLARVHMPPHLLAQPLSQVTAKQMRHWRDALIRDGMLPATVNRVLKCAHAAFNLASKLDPRVAANSQAWKVGLEALRNTVTARDAVLTDAQVLAMVAAAYDVSAAFGLYVQAHAETGARSSQIARLVVGDLHRDRLMVPASHKGRASGKTDRTPVPITPGLAARLKAAAAGRLGNAPLLTKSDGAPWQPRLADHRFMLRQAIRAADLPADTTIYALRHSSIARALLRGLPIKVVADWHDTSTGQIEAHYGRFLKHHYDDLVRGALLDTTPATTSAAIVPLRRA